MLLALHVISEALGHSLEPTMSLQKSSIPHALRLGSRGDAYLTRYRHLAANITATLFICKVLFHTKTSSLYLTRSAPTLCLRSAKKFTAIQLCLMVSAKHMIHFLHSHIDSRKLIVLH
jgi:hypothetical protein